jgi:hypothetical protein
LPSFETAAQMRGLLRMRSANDYTLLQDEDRRVSTPP